MKFRKEELFTIPNILTYIRFICVPLFLWVVFDTNVAKPNNMIVALAIFLFASLTDIADGWIARRFNMGSDIGKVLDPFADKLLQVSALLALSITGNVHWAFTSFLLVKEFYMIIGSTFLVRYVAGDVHIQANIWGKLAALFNAIGIILSFFHKLENANNMYYIDWTFLAIGCLFALIAVINYTKQIVKEILVAREKKKNSKLNPQSEDNKSNEELEVVEVDSHKIEVIEEDNILNK